MPVSWMRIAVVCVGLMVATVATYWPVATYSFVNFDDKEYVYGNPQVLAGLTWPGWVSAWTSFVCGNWQPITVLSLELDGSLCGRTAAGFHATNLVFHTANVLLLFIVLWRMTNSICRSACVAAFFALHPLHVESVAWISERKDVLSTFFLLLTMWAYVAYVSRPSVLRYISVLLQLVLGLLAKPMLVTLPILLLLLDYWPLNRVDWSIRPADDGRFPRQSLRWLILEKLPLFGLALASGLITIVAQGDATKSLPDLTFDVRFAHQFYAYIWYLQKTFVPTGLVAFYPHPERTLSWLSVGIGVLVVGGISAWVLWRRVKQPYLIVGWAWFVIALLPVIGLLQVGSQAYADRYAYVPHIGLFVMIVWEVHSWVAGSQAGRIVGCVVVALSLVACGWLTHVQIAYWTNSETLWTHALEIIPENGTAHFGLGEYLRMEGEYERAIKHFELGLPLKRSGVADAYCSWGRCLIGLDRPAEAEQKLLAALKINPYHEVALDELSKLLAKQGRHTEVAQVAEQYDKAIARRATENSNDYAVEVHLGLKQIRKGNIKQAAVHFEKAVQLAPQSAAARNNLASAQLDLKQVKAAKASFLKAVELNSELAGAHFSLAEILEAEGDFSGAKSHFAEVVRIDPNDAEAKQRLARLSNR